jgi:ElaB/YqjD/DUF883 family membrane-anchored ribosome-binding protein
MSEASAHSERLMTDLKRVVGDAEALLRSTADTADESARTLRKRVQASLDEAQVNLASLQEATVEKARAAARAADGYVHDNPWSSIGAAAALGLLVGVLLGRR